MNPHDSDLHDLQIGGTVYRTKLTKKWRERKPTVLPDQKRVITRIPGLITEVHVATGDVVARGDSLLVLEAMKMQNSVTTSIAGTVKAVHVAVGDLVAKGDLLAEIEA